MTMRKIHFNLPSGAVLLACVPRPAVAQCTAPDGGRIAAILAGTGVSQVAVIAARHNDWWDTPRTGFHFAWGGSPSRGQDALLHSFIAYQLSDAGNLVWRWACVDRGTAAWLGAAWSIANALPKEIGDGLRVGKGFSGTDFSWTVAGAMLPALRQTVPVFQAVSFKAQYWPSDEYRNRSGNLPQLENDYAGQRYYLVINPGMIGHGKSGWPRWLGMALGHSVQAWTIERPEHEWYLTFDLMVSGIFRSGIAHKLSSLLDRIHLPAPGVRIFRGSVEFGVF